MISYSPRPPGSGGPASIAWIKSWHHSSSGWHLRCVRRRDQDWHYDVEPVGALIRARAFEPSAPGLRTAGMENRWFDISDLQALSPLLEPRELIGRVMPGAELQGHSIYVATTPTGRIYFPAFLLISHLWLWSPKLIDALMAPNSLDTDLGPVRETPEGDRVEASARLAPTPVSEASMHRIAWLARCANARASWSSVLSYALSDNQINLQLPKTRMAGWVWGVTLPSGLLACELGSVRLGS